jgi:spermidine/putrescine transport system ATP-binding protein
VIENVVYFGTDTNIHVRLDGGDLFMVRLQNARGKTVDFDVGDHVGVVISAGAAQVLRD